MPRRVKKGRICRTGLGRVKYDPQGYGGNMPHRVRKGKHALGVVWDK